MFSRWIKTPSCKCFKKSTFLDLWHLGKSIHYFIPVEFCRVQYENLVHVVALFQRFGEALRYQKCISKKLSELYNDVLINACLWAAGEYVKMLVERYCGSFQNICGWPWLHIFLMIYVRGSIKFLSRSV